MRARRAVLPIVALALLRSAAPASAAPAPTIERVIIVGRSDPDSPWTDLPTEASLAQSPGLAPEPAPTPAPTPAPELAVVALGRAGKRAVVIADPELGPLRLNRRAVSAASRVDWSELGDVEVEWRMVEPRGFRTTPAANGATSEYYSNVSTERGTFGKWLGYDRIEYTETPVGPPSRGSAARRLAVVLTGTDERTPAATKQALGTEHLGTQRFRAVLRLADGRELATPGAEATDALGILPTVHRVSIRRGDDFLGYLSAYLLVPEVFGSAGGGAQNQTERWVGADCADVMVGALRKSGRRDVPYTNVASLPRYAPLVDGPLAVDDQGRPEHPITRARPGDLIRIDYGGSLVGHTPRAWDHVAAWWQDRSDPSGPHHGEADGQLDGFDLVIHMGHPRLVIEPLAAQMPATIDVLRWATPRSKR